MGEIEKAMVRLGMSKKYFTIKTLTPIYPLYFDRFTDENHYRDMTWSLKDAIRKEKETKKEVDAVLHSFKYRGLFSKSSIRRHLDDTPDNFNLNHEFL